MRAKLVAGLVIAAVAIAAVLFQISKAHCFQLVGDVTCRVETDRKIVALSFDDGPTPEGVDAVLPVLDQFGAKATFFLIGDRIEKFPGQAERLLEAGHELGNHTYSHQRNLMKPREFYRSEVRRADELLRSAGAQTDLFRPPFGKRLIGLPLEVEAAGYRTVTWDVEDNPEAFEGDAAGFAQDILARVEPGSIILIHPMYRHNQTARDALPIILSGLSERGYAIVTVGELLESADE